MDLRVSGKDLIGNHLTFCLYTHAAIWVRGGGGGGGGGGGEEEEEEEEEEEFSFTMFLILSRHSEQLCIRVVSESSLRKPRCSGSPYCKGFPCLMVSGSSSSVLQSSAILRFERIAWEVQKSKQCRSQVDVINSFSFASLCFLNHVFSQVESSDCMFG